MTDRGKAHTVLTLNTLAFAVCFMCWMTNGVLITHLVDSGTYRWGPAQIGWLIGIPVLTGSVARLPVGLLTDRYGGRAVFGALMLMSAIPMYLMGEADTFVQFLILSLAFGLTGASFAVGIAYTSVWYPQERQGTALGIFGAGNAGAAITSLGAPYLLNWFTANGASPEGWRQLPRLYAAILLVTALIFLVFTHTRVASGGGGRTLVQRLAPLRAPRVWRFGLYYFLVFGGFVALAQWLIPYYVNVYTMSLASAGLMATIFSLPSGVVRALGGWMSDLWGARAVMQWVLGSCLLCFALLVVPQMEIRSPGSGVMARSGGTVQRVAEDEIIVASPGGEIRYPIRARNGETEEEKWQMTDVLVFPKAGSWQEPAVSVGQVVQKRELLARGITHIYFQANVWIFTGLVFIVGIAMGIGKAAVYKNIPEYFPNDVGVVGGVVGVLGGLGGFACPILFGYLLKTTGLWTTCWMLFFLLTLACLIWMHTVVRRLMKSEAPAVLRQIEDDRFVSVGSED